MSFAVDTPIINAPYDEPNEHWRIRQGETPQRVAERRRSLVYQPPEQRDEWDLSDGTLAKVPPAEEGAYAGRSYEMVLVNRIRERVKAWRAARYPGATRVSVELLEWWRREGRQQRLFFAQLEAAETVIFLREARADLLQGIVVPGEVLGAEALAAGVAPFTRYACKMATGSGKTTVMGMLSAWSILNKVADRTSRAHSDAVLVVCPNVTIRERLRELRPDEGEASVYRTRDLVPPVLMPQLARGRMLVTNWHVFEPQSMQQGGTGSRVLRAGVPVETTETVVIGEKNTVARGSRYMSRSTYAALVASGEVFVKTEETDGNGEVKKAVIYSRRWVESDTALLERVLGREIGKKQNVLVFNDEAHHAYRIRQGTDAEDDAESLTGTAADDDEIAREATVWVEGLDRVQKHRGINCCIDLSATPYFLARAGRDTARPFPWTVSDFALVDAIESGLVKIPQLPAQDTTGSERPPYFNIWEWVKGKLTPAEKGKRGEGGFKPEAVLKYAAQPIALLAGDWREEFGRWRTDRPDDPRPPVFIIVCKDIKLAKVVFEWIAEDIRPQGISSFGVTELRNAGDALNTIRVDSQVVFDTDEPGGSKGDEMRWLRFTLDTVGKTHWPRDRQERPIYPAGFEELAGKFERPLDPPGRDIRCIVSVGMLTEGWDANTVTHIVGLRPFMSQLLCEQVVGRGLRRASYEPGEDGLLGEELAQVFGVPFEVIPYKGTGAAPPPRPKRFRVHALAERKALEITFPRVVGYTQAVRNRVTVDWERVPKLVLAPGKFPTVVTVGSLAQTDSGHITTAQFGGRVRELSMSAYHAGMRFQEGVFHMAADLTREYSAQAQTSVPPHVLFPQLRAIVDRFVRERVDAPAGMAVEGVFVPPYYGWALEILREAVHPDESAGESAELPRLASPPSATTADVDYWTSRDVWPVQKSHLNYVVADSGWEKKAAFQIDRHKDVTSFVKNAGVGLAIPYLHNGQPHDYLPDFIVRLDGEAPRYLLLETKGHDELWEVKKAAAERWVDAVNAGGEFGTWSFEMARTEGDVAYILKDIAKTGGTSAVREATAYGIDPTLIESSLKLTPAQRLAQLQANSNMIRSARVADKERR